MLRLRSLYSALSFCFLLPACSLVDSNIEGDMLTKPAIIDVTTEASSVLRSLPPAKRKVPVAVYEFSDKTGQHKPNTNFSEYSRAVTQGGLDMLQGALLDAGNYGWFTVINRSGLQNLLQERKIIGAMRQEAARTQGKQFKPLKALLYAGVLLEGGIVAYDSDIVTGGLGAGYLGISGHTDYRRDIVNVYLRAVSVNTGEVLLSVNTAKTVYSFGLSGNVFKFVAFDKILELETGFTRNEPPQLAVRQAIESAVYSLIMEGYIKELWQFEDPHAGQAAIAQYLERRDGSAPAPTLETAAAPIPMPAPTPVSTASPTAPTALPSQAPLQQWARRRPANPAAAPAAPPAQPQYAPREEFNQITRTPSVLYRPETPETSYYSQSEDIPPPARPEPSLSSLPDYNPYRSYGRTRRMLNAPPTTARPAPTPQ